MTSLRLGDAAPNFTASTTEGELDFLDWKGDAWAVLFSHPADFTPVCTTELARVAQLKDEWAARNTKVLAVSVDVLDDHTAWKSDIEDTAGTGVDYPIIADPDREVSELYGMIHPGEGDTSPVRSVFIIDPAGKVRLTLTYPKSAGRNFDEILRTLDALQVNDAGPYSTPVDWRKGDKVIIAPSVSTEDARERYDGVEVVKPYLRYITQPQG
ncbi:Peroxiredoxin-like protein DDB_G0282517,mitochondrial [Nostocoides japonicum T1-X7]|uniref:Peroxiredoxin-like protein DDB_G0282517,mitochondrial n=1 Tax=Nostocoides japonicum T1-X7 TaxID=1194083 RepID=A0A077LV03_9MICO|nr:peroxiredoxin [Tetrasphaera japonica]CCH76577.1 Peroxiredoxin-like protein DDB_G0282517,mitochondrial [Tetrasphaera japonica T1-X7]